MRPETAQDQQDELVSQCIGKLKSRRTFEAVIAEVVIGKAMPLTAYDPIDQVLRKNPTLTLEKAEEMAQAFGF